MEKDLIDRTNEVEEIVRKLKNKYESNINNCCCSAENILGFLTSPISTRFVRNYHVNHAMLVNQKITLPNTRFYENKEELKYNVWVCQQIEIVKKVLREYRDIVNTLYRLMVDYLIIRDEQIRVEKLLENTRTELEEIIKNPIIDTICQINDIIEKFKRKFNETERKDSYDIGIFNSMEIAEDYMKEVVDSTIKEFPIISQQDISKVDSEYWEFFNVAGRGFEDIEWELEGYEVYNS